MDEPQDLRAIGEPPETLHGGTGVAGKDDLGLPSGLEEVGSNHQEFREEGPFGMGSLEDESPGEVEL